MLTQSRNQCLAIIRKIDYDKNNLELVNKLKSCGFFNQDMKDSKALDSLIEKVKNALPTTNFIEYKVIF